MPRLKLTTGGMLIAAELFDKPTADTLCAARPFSGTAMTLSEDVDFAPPIKVRRESDARAVVPPAEPVFWLDGNPILIGFGPTPISRDREICLASPSNVRGRALNDNRKLRTVYVGALITVERVD